MHEAFAETAHHIDKIQAGLDRLLFGAIAFLVLVSFSAGLALGAYLSERDRRRGVQ